MASALDLTIAIPVRNEEKNLPGCLAAIGKDFAFNVVLIDSGSIDATPAIAKEHGVELVHFEWNGEFPKKRNWFLRNYPIKTKWILFLDADEYLTPAFKNELRTTLGRDHDQKAGYWLNYTIYFLGKELKGGYPLRKLALFQVGAGEYERIDEKQWSHFDMEVHEHPILAGEVGFLNSKIDHQDFRGVSHYVSKHNEYASWEAARYLNLSSIEPNSASWTWKQRLKYKLMNTILIGPAFFCGSYFFHGGFRDGGRGLAFAIFKMAYFTQIYCKIRESKPS
ncbi:glycosyltransferase family 2 protein [Hymenobacter sp. BT188]|uniref:glycosyltransferase family 2 protein n=1 Tax=Hymenobacter sp. BT188 TaxID=2763504 RepID=UPI00165119E6|nr:glycosyltransferase family 2 protein [Hymenobacter sp. BT188]MBC6608749.1 glycosyltransferase family 2 protein [Hymenobacter sp. BT188]